MKPTLLILAAGMGSRYGGLKQLDGLGPKGETIMDYSVFDAVRSGFGKVVFVIRQSFEKDFREKIVQKYAQTIPVEVVFQELGHLPAGFSLPPERVKPWGTNHATMMGRDVIHEPFAVINADDFYGRASYQILCDFLTSVAGKENLYAMVGYRVGNTLSESGSVARGVCAVDGAGFLTSVVERTAILREADGQIRYTDEAGQSVAIDDHTPVSMNMWGFTPEYFRYSETAFADFLRDNAGNPKAEFYIPSVVNRLIIAEQVQVRVLDTPAPWFGVTYQNDRASVVSKIHELINRGEYPKTLF
jgi:hypothetical protein